MTDKLERMTIGEALEVVCRYARTHQRTSPELQAALAAFDGWGEPITEEWLQDQGMGTDNPGEAIVELVIPSRKTIVTFTFYEHDDGYWIPQIMQEGGKNICGVTLLYRKLKTRGDLVGMLHFLGVEI